MARQLDLVKFINGEPDEGVPDPPARHGSWWWERDDDRLAGLV
jgi:hypothetical protein